MELKLQLGTCLLFYILITISVINCRLLPLHSKMHTEVCAEFCVEYGHSCNEPYKCCGATCCIPTELEHHYHNQLRWSVWNMWYFWFVVLFVLMSCFGGCSYYRRHQLLLARHQGMLGEGTRTYPDWQFSSSFPVSLFSGYNTHSGHQRAAGVAAVPIQTEPSTQIPRQIFPSPPAYSEVVSHPEVYPPHKDAELPPYPGPQTQPMYTGGPVVQLPPYSPPAGTMATDHDYHGNQNQHSISNTNITDGNHANSNTDGISQTVVTPGGRTQYNCKTQTVSGIGD